MYSWTDTQRGLLTENFSDFCYQVYSVAFKLIIPHQLLCGLFVHAVGRRLEWKKSDNLRFFLTDLY